MRKITIEAANSFTSGNKYKSGNTEVVLYGETIHLYLHGHLIAKKDNGDIKISNSGYFTNVTKERLNGLPGVNISQKKGHWYLNGSEWDGKWIKVN